METASEDRPPSIYPILAVNFVGTLGFSVVLPFLVFLVTRWGGNALVYGIMGATYSSFQLVGAPILGRWSDRYGRRKILLVSQLGTLISWFVFVAAFALPTEPLFSVSASVVGRFAVTLPLVVMFVARACDGITGGNVSVANAYLADITQEKDRSANFGKMAVAANLGFIVGPTLAGLLGGTAWGELLPVLAALGISFVATLLIAFGLPESRPCILLRDPEPTNVRKIFGQEPKPCFEIRGADQIGLRAVLGLAGVAPLLLVYFLVMLGFNFFYVSFPVYAAEGLSWSVRDIGLYFSTMSLSMVLVQGPLLGRLSKKLTDETLAVAGSLILAAAFVFFTSSRAPLLYAGVLWLALGNGLMWPSVVSMLSKAAGSRYQGAVQGVAGSSGAVASIAGLLLGGALYARLDASVFLVSAATILAVFFVNLYVSYRVRARRRAT